MLSNSSQKFKQPPNTDRPFIFMKALFWELMMYTYVHECVIFVTYQKSVWKLFSILFSRSCRHFEFWKFLKQQKRWEVPIFLVVFLTEVNGRKNLIQYYLVLMNRAIFLIRLCGCTKLIFWVTHKFFP